MKHTPGLWFINENSSDCGADKLSIEPKLNGYDYFIAQVDGGAYQLANARLIAAAPELLEALTAVFDNFCCETMAQNHAMNKVRAAIAKAIGE